MSDKYVNAQGVVAIKNYIDDADDFLAAELLSIPLIKIDGSNNTTAEELITVSANYPKALYLVENGGLTITNVPGMELFGNEITTEIFYYNSENSSNTILTLDSGLVAGLDSTSAVGDEIVAQWASASNVISEATEQYRGGIKLNPNESITLNSDGQLDIGGRLGQFSGSTGIYHSKDREPRNVNDFSFLITDAKGMDLSAPRNFALVTGVNLALTGSHAVGSTTYTVANNYANRIACAVLYNGGQYGYVSQSEAYSKENQIVKVTSVKINGSNFTPDSSANDSSKPIVITTEKTANPTQAVTQLRVFGSINGGYCSEYIGQCVGGTVGASLIIGQRVFSSNNVNCVVSADVYNTGNGNAIFGRQHISRKNRGLIAGTGHDTTNAKSEGVVALGEWSLISSDTAFAIGNGTSHTNRKNLFEVKTNGDVYVNGTKLNVP